MEKIGLFFNANDLCGGVCYTFTRTYYKYIVPLK